MRAETIRFLNKTFVRCRPARTISRECSSSMRSRDHVLHNLTACRLQWPHAASGQEPHPFVFVAAVNNIESVRVAHWTLVLFLIASVLWKLNHGAMKLLLQEIRRNPLLWLLIFVPIALAAEKLDHEAHTLHFVLSVLAILPLAVLLSHATESVAAKTGDSVGGLLNATLGNLTELVIAIAALQAGQYTLVKASVAGAIVTNSLFMLGASFLLGGLRYHLQEFNRVVARFQAGLLFLATIALLIPSAVAAHDSLGAGNLTKTLSLVLSFLLLLAYGLGLWFSLNTHREF